MPSFDINAAIYAILVGDAAIKSLLGYTATRPGVYYIYPPNTEYFNLTGNQAILLYFMEGLVGDSPKQNPTNEWPPMNLVFDIYSTSQKVITQIWDRLMDLFRNKKLTAGEWTIHNLSISIGFRDLVEPDMARERIYHRHTRFRLNFVYRNTPSV